MLLTACNPSNPAPEGNGWDFKVVTEMHPANSSVWPLGPKQCLVDGLQAQTLADPGWDWVEMEQQSDSYLSPAPLTQVTGNGLLIC